MASAALRAALGANGFQVRVHGSLHCPLNAVIRLLMRASRKLRLAW